MGKENTSARISLVIIEILILLGSIILFVLGYFRIKSGTLAITDSLVRHYSNVGLLYVAISFIVLVLFFVILLIAFLVKKKD